MPDRKELLKILKSNIKGDIFTDNIWRILYSTDASAYREKPLAVVRPKNEADVKKIVQFAARHKLPIIPRTAGTSLAGQVVGNGIVVDVSKYMTRIIELNKEENWVKVQPGVILDELNQFLESHGLFFGPETSTSNRCMIGGMLGNNSCGSHSLLYGSTRDHTLEIKTILSDGSEAVFGELSPEEFNKKCQGNSLENKIYQNIKAILSDKKNQQEIRKKYPRPDINRRNHGYALDLLLETEIFSDNHTPFNFCKLLAGSEGTLAFSTEIKLNLVPLPPKEKAVIAAHFESIPEAFKANLVALKHKPGAVEMMDKVVLDCTKENIEQKKNRFFIKGDPAALLIIEFERETKEEIKLIAHDLEKDMRDAGFGYHFPVIFGSDIKRIWALRKAGLGLLSNVPGDKRSETIIEDTAVHPEDLPNYMLEFQQVLTENGLDCVFYAHIGSGELHLRPMITLKTQEGVELFDKIGWEIARLVKKYRGSLSGEHGDGRLRGQFIPFMIGDYNYELLKKLKAAWDPNHIFNPGKITDTPPNTENLRFEIGETREIDTIFDFSSTKGIIRATEKCNGSGDCRKSEKIGGTMCPSYMATRDEKNATRARANILREFLTHSKKDNPFDHKEIYEVFDLCLSCKACKSECPSSVDVAKLKAEFLQHYYDAHGVPMRSRLIANISKINALGSVVPGFMNFFFKNKFFSGLMKRSVGFAPERSMPLLSKQTLKKQAFNEGLPREYPNGTVYLFNDEFTNFNDADIGIKAIRLLNRLGYRVLIPEHIESGRAYLSKGLIRKAKKIANENIELLKDIISGESPLIGIEPSAILTFRDEYPELVNKQNRHIAKKISENSLMVDEFIAREIEKGKIKSEQFTREPKRIKLHGHCQQKAIASTNPTKAVLSLPENYQVEEIPSGCCGMAGSFGYEKEHYEISQKVGELVLFPEIRKTPEETLISAPGTSCRHQIKDGTKREALHPVEILFDALL